MSQKNPPNPPGNPSETDEEAPVSGADGPAGEPGVEDLLAQKDREIQELKEELLRLRADTENYRKRLQKDKEDMIRYANEGLIRDLVPIYDNLLRALEAPEVSVQSLKEGVEMIARQFLSFMEKHHIEPIEAIGEPFDPNLHEVLSQVESDQHEEGTIVDQYGKGYKLHDRVLIPAKVVTTRPPSPSSSEENSPS